MNGLTLLRDIRLVPVLELEPWEFSAEERPRPSGSVLETPEWWGASGTTAWPIRGSPG